MNGTVTAEEVTKIAQKVVKSELKRYAANLGVSKEQTVTTTPPAPVDTVGTSLFTPAELDNRERLLNAIIRKCEIDENLAGMMRHVPAPKGHPEHMSFSTASSTYFPDEKMQTVLMRYNHACSKIVAALVYGKEHAESGGIPARTRNITSSKSKVLVSQRKEHERKMRAKLGVGKRGRVRSELQTQLNQEMEKWDEKHPSM